MFQLNNRNVQMLHQHIDTSLDKVNKDGFYTEGFDYIFKSHEFFENTNFNFIFDIIEESKHYVNSNNISGITKISVYYDLLFPLFQSFINIKAYNEADLLYFIHNFPHDKTRLTPPKLILEKASLRGVVIPENWLDYNIQSVEYNFFSGKVSHVKTYLVTVNDSKSSKAYETKIWFDLYL